jgi:hypothetical protein
VNAVLRTTAILLAALWLPAGAGCGGGGPDEAETAAPPPDRPVSPPPAASVTPEGAPRLTFEKTSHSFGTVSDARTYTVRFPFTNTGTGRLRITSIKASCGCTVPTLDRYEFDPGEGSAIEVVYDPAGKQGQNATSMTILSNAEPASVRIPMSSVVAPMLRFERWLRLDVLRLGETHRSVVNMYHTDRDLEIGGVSVNNPHVSARVIATGDPDPRPDGNERYRAQLEVVVGPGAAWGPIYATQARFDVTARPEPGAAAVTKAYKLFILGSLFGELHAEPTIVSFGVIRPGAAFSGSALLTRPSGAPFTVTEARVTETTIAGIEARARKQDATTWRILLSGAAGSYLGQIRGVVTVRTSLPAPEDQVELRFAGLVKQ